MPVVKNPRTVDRPVFKRVKCINCGEEYEHITRWQKYCSPSCRNGAYTSRQRKAKEEAGDPYER